MMVPGEWSWSETYKHKTVTDFLFFCHEADIIVSVVNASPGSNILRTMQRKGSIFLIDTEVCEIVGEICKDKTKSETEGTVEMQEWIMFHSCRGYC